MASQEPSVQFNENPDYELIPKEQSIFNFNFDSPSEQDSPEDEQAIAKIIQDEEIIDEASQSAYKAVQDELKEVEEESTPYVISKKSTLSTKVFEQAELQEEIVEVVAAQPPRARRISHPSVRFAASLQQQQEEANLREAIKQEAQRRLEAKQKEKSELLEVIDTENVTDSQLNLVSGIDETDTSLGHRLITIGRLETYKPSSQAGVIFGDQFMRGINGNTLCALCGFKLKDRISYWHNVFHKKKDPENTLTWSFDHRPPINFSAIMFRIVVATGTYTPEELENLRVTGDIVCFHCNYEKSQRLFITCPVEKDTDKSNFSGFSPNDEAIEKYVNDLFNSKHRYGYSQVVGERTLQNCLKAAGKSKKDWITQRIKHITGLAQQVCDIIRDKVDRANVERRYKLTKIIVRQAKQQALKDKLFPDKLEEDQKTRFTKEYTAKIFAAAELKTFPKPWKVSSAPVRVPVPPPDPRGEPGRSRSRQRTRQPDPRNIPRGGSRRKLKKNKRKTFRRKRLF
jgi:hypothetical protein